LTFEYPGSVMRKSALAAARAALGKEG
jgi:hypothetical protein